MSSCDDFPYQLGGILVVSKGLAFVRFSDFKQMVFGLAGGDSATRVLQKGTD